MSNLKEFTKAEFLSFLYAEKSREIENNSVPGWNKWALIGAITSVIIFLYSKITTNYSAYDYEVLLGYINILVPVASLILLFRRYNSGVKLYMSEKVRPLKDEVSVRLYISQFGMCLVAGIIQYYWHGISFAFVFLTIAILINAYILIYIFVNRDRFVLAKLKTQVFVDCEKDNFIHSLLTGLYCGTISFLIIDLLKTHQCFYPSEFESAIGLIVLTMLIYKYLKISKKNNEVADEIDRIINKFVVGAISQEDAYKKYILIIYGFSAYQTIENDLGIIEDIKNNYNKKINTINNLKNQLQNEIRSFDDLQKIQQTLEKEIRDSQKTLYSLSKLLDKIKEISKLGIPAIVDKEFSAVIDDYEKASVLFSDLIIQIKSVKQEVMDKYYCKKYGELCFISFCKQSNDPMSLRYKLKRKIRLLFLGSSNNKNTTEFRQGNRNTKAKIDELAGAEERADAGIINWKKNQIEMRNIKENIKEMISKIRKVDLECVISFFKNKLVIFSLIYMLFYSFWEDIIGNTVVDKFFSHFGINIISDIIFYLLLAYVIIKSFQTKTIKKEKIIASIIILAFWYYYRFCSERFVFFSLATIEEVKYIDIVAVYSFCEILNCRKNIHKSSFVFGDGFDRDSPIEKDNDDLLGRKDLAEDAVKKMLNTDTSIDAFSFGITSPWGDGKTSFMNLMKNYIKTEHRECISIDFNPWLSSHKGDIITLFFDELSKILREYDRGLASEITNYSNILSSIETAETKIASTIIDIIMPSSKLEDKITTINKSIKQIGKKIVVFVDDIDRLDATEIMEVLKLIRNISNFPYMYFVVAYDKDYILECLKERMPSKELKYTEKIFQVEFPLPLFEKEIIKKSIYDSISKFVKNDDDKIELSNLLNEINIFGKGNAIIEDNISTIRDVKRIVNSFYVSYSWLKGEINVCDLFVLEILKTKYPIVYSILARDYQYVLKRNDSDCYVLFSDITQSNYFFSRFDEKDKYDLKKYLTENHTQLHINDSDEKKIISILSRLFPSDAFDTSKKNINNFFYTRKYFSIKILESDISESKFDEVIQKDMDTIKFYFAKWSENKSNALYARLKQFQPKDKEEQKKYIRILLYSTSIIQCDSDFITNQIIGLKELNNNKHFSDEDKQFIKSSLCENGYSKGLALYLYEIGFEDNAYNYPITKDELNDVRRYVFNDCINKNREDIRKVMDGYQNTEETYLENKKMASTSIPEKKSSMKSYVTDHFVDFITCTIIRHGLDQYFVNKWWPTHLWDDWEKFVSYLNEKKDKTPEIKEYIEFINKCDGTDREAGPISFTFKHLKPQN